MAKASSANTTLAKATPGYDDNVFINCPFDRQYKPIFDAIVFAIHDAGFVARCALEAIDSGQTRLEKILEIIGNCKYGIHDISRTEVGRSKLPRFNMPFECGVFWGCYEFGDSLHKMKRLLVLDSEPFRYRASLSDIAGQDIQAHNNNPQEAIDKVRSWLNSKSGRTTIPGGKEIWKHYALFQRELPLMLKAARITRAELHKPEYYPDYVSLIVHWLTQHEAKARDQEII
jgi:hypothetical protein